MYYQFPQSLGGQRGLILYGSVLFLADENLQRSKSGLEIRVSLP